MQPFEYVILLFSLCLLHAWYRVVTSDEYFWWKINRRLCKLADVTIVFSESMKCATISINAFGGSVKDIKDILVGLRPGEWVNSRGKRKDFKPMRAF